MADPLVVATWGASWLTGSQPSVMNPTQRLVDRAWDHRMSQEDLFGPTTPLPEGFVYRTEFLTAAEQGTLIATIRELPPS